MCQGQAGTGQALDLSLCGLDESQASHLLAV